MRVGDILTQIGRGTPMGTLMRQYWMPALLSSELKSDGAPVRLKLLGENLIAFRDTDGRVGILDHVCPHRCASLFFGRNEENGIRCVYHGWKFSAQGKVWMRPTFRTIVLNEKRFQSRPIPPRSILASCGFTWDRVQLRPHCPTLRR